MALTGTPAVSSNPFDAPVPPPVQAAAAAAGAAVVQQASQASGGCLASISSNWNDFNTWRHSPEGARAWLITGVFLTTIGILLLAYGGGITSTILPIVGFAIALRGYNGLQKMIDTAQGQIPPKAADEEIPPGIQGQFKKAMKKVSELSDYIQSPAGSRALLITSVFLASVALFVLLHGGHSANMLTFLPAAAMFVYGYNGIQKMIDTQFPHPRPGEVVAPAPVAAAAAPPPAAAGESKDK